MLWIPHGHELPNERSWASEAALRQRTSYLRLVEEAAERLHITPLALATELGWPLDKPKTPGVFLRMWPRNTAILCSYLGLGTERKSISEIAEEHGLSRARTKYHINRQIARLYSRYYENSRYYEKEA